MPRHCSVGGCKSRDNRETRNAGITFHKLPKGTTRRNLWITNSHRSDPWDPQTDFVYFCSKHFTPQSFELTGCRSVHSDGKHESSADHNDGAACNVVDLLTHSGIRRLKEDAFPTVFDLSSAAKDRKAAALQKQEDILIRKSSCSGKEENTLRETNHSQTAEETTVHRSVPAAEETNGIPPESSQELSVVLSQQEPSPSLPESRPLSPSRYMRRLPPPPGFYLSKEHNYAQLFPLLWRRRYDQVVDCLEKALRQLHAARRRENRLRSTVLRLRDKRLKHTLLMSRDGCKNRGRWTPGQRKEDSDLGESETDGKSDGTGLYEDRCGDQMELGCRFLPDTSSWSEEEKGCCFYCGRGQAACGVSETRKDVQPTEHDEPLQLQISSETSTHSTADNQTVRLERPGKNVETNVTDVTTSQVLVQNPGLHHVTAAEVFLPDTIEQSVQILDSDMCEGESEALGKELHLQHQLFFIKYSTEGQFILLPVHTEDGLQSFFKADGVKDEAQPILVSELDLNNGGVGHMTEYSRGLSRDDGDHINQHSVVNSTSVEMREDVRERLKEHLEGFHLQLSTEFRN